MLCQPLRLGDQRLFLCKPIQVWKSAASRSPLVSADNPTQGARLDRNDGMGSRANRDSLLVNLVLLGERIGSKGKTVFRRPRDIWESARINGSWEGWQLVRVAVNLPIDRKNLNETVATDLRVFCRLETNFDAGLVL